MVATKAFDEIVDFLAGYEPERILNFHLSAQTQERVEALLAKKHNQQLTEAESSELAYFAMLEHIIRLAKARALKTMAP